MFLAGMGVMKGMQAHLLSDPKTSLLFILLAYALLFGAELTGTLLFWRYGRTAALTAGLISGTRTITLAWVVLGNKILPLADLFLATSMIAKYTAPGLTKWLLADHRHGWGSGCSFDPAKAGRRVQLTAIGSSSLVSEATRPIRSKLSSRLGIRPSHYLLWVSLDREKLPRPISALPIIAIKFSDWPRWVNTRYRDLDGMKDVAN
jgi:hypothetical protein